MISKKFILFTIFSQWMFFSNVFSDDSACVFKLNENLPKSTLILLDHPFPQFLLPNEHNTIKIPKNTEIRLSCAGNLIDHACKTDEIKVKCEKLDHVKFKYHILCQKERKLEELECLGLPLISVKSTDTPCYNHNKVVEIGYWLSKKSFLKILSVCYDDFEEKVIYSWYENSNIYLGIQNKIKNLEYAGQEYIQIPVKETYDVKYQKKLFTKLLKSEELANRYIQDDELHKIVIGQLITKEELMYGPQQRAAFHYLNSAPQWQIFKEGNWAKLEQNLRDYLINGGKKFSVASGTYGVATLPDIFGEQKKLYLFSDQYDNNYLPIPKFYWKVVYDNLAKTGIAVIGIHNPFIKEVTKDYILCDDISSKVTWLKLDDAHVERGYFYVCEFDAFLKATGIQNMFEVK